METQTSAKNIDPRPCLPETTSTKKQVRRIVRKMLGFVAAGLLLGFLADFAATRNDSEHPAGLAWGMAHGALMPTTLPALIMGQDVTIYAPHNEGRLYKIGYALGVNVCGLLFFGAVFWNPSHRTPKSEPQRPGSGTPGQ